MARAQGIGEVLAELRADFPETTISKLRFLESEGLVEPERTPAGYRKYSPADVARLRYVLTAQRDYYLPLRVIREHLSAIDKGLPPPRVAGQPAAPEPGPASESVPLVRRGESELLSASGLTAEQLEQITELGLVAAEPDGSYGPEALTVCGAVAVLARYGFQPRHLRSFRSAADREIGLFNQVLLPIVRQRDGEVKAKLAATELVELAAELHAALVRQGLRTTLEKTTPLVDA